MYIYNISIATYLSNPTIYVSIFNTCISWTEDAISKIPEYILKSESLTQPGKSAPAGNPSFPKGGKA